jgi:hypothetical protein
MEVYTNSVSYTLQKDTYYGSTVTRQGQHDGYSVEVDNQSGISDSRGVFTVSLANILGPAYDGTYSVEIFDVSGDLVLIDTLSRVRQYASTDAILAYMQGKVNPTQAAEYERIARHQINAIVGAPFSFEKKILDYPGNDTDMLITDERLGGEVFRVFENGQQIYDSTTPGNQNFYRPANSAYALVMDTYDDYTYSGLAETFTMEHGRTWSTRNLSPLFKENYDYRIDAEWGWKVVPQDVQDATLMLVNDIACGNNRYSSKYIDSFRNGQASVDYFKEVIKGTGNLIVDNILSKYTLESIRAKVL